MLHKAKIMGSVSALTPKFDTKMIPTIISIAPTNINQPDSSDIEDPIYPEPITIKAIQIYKLKATKLIKGLNHT